MDNVLVDSTKLKVDCDAERELRGQKGPIYRDYFWSVTEIEKRRVSLNGLFRTRKQVTKEVWYHTKPLYKSYGNANDAVLIFCDKKCQPNITVTLFQQPQQHKVITKER